MDALIRNFQRIFLTTVAIAPVVFLNCGCQITYIAKSAMGQLKIMTDQVPVDQALKSENLSDEQKQKLKAAQAARLFAESELGLKTTKNYTRFVELNRPYVTYVVSAAEKWQLKPYLFKYPVVGKMPYKGFFNEADANTEAESLKSQGLDTYQRGVSAYSTLGWFSDPILSSMLRYSEEDLVDTIIHETVHTTIYIKNNADFNERLAVFLGQRGAELYYLKNEGPESKSLKKIQESIHDDQIFSYFIGAELKELEKWYLELPAKDRTDNLREARLENIRSRFYKEVHPRLKTQSHYGFQRPTLNNAILLVFKTYLQDLSLFAELFELSGKNYQNFIQTVRDFEEAKDPESAMRAKILELKSKK